MPDSNIPLSNIPHRTQRIYHEEYEDHYLLTSGITAVTFLQSSSGDLTAISSFLRRRLGQVLIANPWLVATLDKSGRSFTYPDSVGGFTSAGEECPVLKGFLDKLFPPSSKVSLAKVSFSRRSSYAEINRVGLQVDVGGCGTLKGSGNPVSKLVVMEVEPKVAENSDSDSSNLCEVAVFFSLSHMVGDGHTFYKIFNMLGARGKIESMCIERRCGLEEPQKTPPRKQKLSKKYLDERVMGKAAMRYATSAGFFKQLLINNYMVANPHEKGPQGCNTGKYFAYYLDDAKVKAMKQAFQARREEVQLKSGGETFGLTDAAERKVPEDAAKDNQDVPANDVSFVSTNDILASQFGCWSQPTLLLMVLNTRERGVPGTEHWTALQAGCYNPAVIYDPAGYGSPEGVRVGVSRKGTRGYSGQKEIFGQREYCEGGLGGAVVPNKPKKYPKFWSRATFSFLTSWMFEFSLDVPELGENGKEEGNEEEMESDTTSASERNADVSYWKQVLHLPIQSLAIFSKKIPKPLRTMLDVGIVFAPQPGKTAILLFPKRAKANAEARGNVSAGWKGDDSVLGECVDSDVFHFEE